MIGTGATATVLLTGGSRGVGAAAVRALTARGWRVAFTYREKAARAAAVVAAVGADRAWACQADLTAPADLDRLARQLRQRYGQLAGLVLNASGGLERDRLAADPDFALHLNRDAQLDLVERVEPLLAVGSTIVFVTSHWAHFYGQQAILPAYEAVAHGKHAGEMALRARQATLAARGIRLIVVSGDVVAGTITPRLLQRGAPGLIAERQAQVGTLPTVDDMAAAIVQALVDPDLPTGHTLYVGSTAAGTTPG